MRHSLSSEKDQEVLSDAILRIYKQLDGNLDELRKMSEEDRLIFIFDWALANKTVYNTKAMDMMLRLINRLWAVRGIDPTMRLKSQSSSALVLTKKLEDTVRKHPAVIKLVGGSYLSAPEHEDDGRIYFASGRNGVFVGRDGKLFTVTLHNGPKYAAGQGATVDAALDAAAKTGYKVWRAK